MALTPQSTLRQWIVEALDSLDGSARRGEVLDRIEASRGHLLTPADVEVVESRPFEVKWRNRASWERDHMVKEGVLVPGLPTWTLTTVARERLAASRPPVALRDLLAEFKPKSSAEYRQRVVGRVLVKERQHEALVADFGRYVAAGGFAPRTNVHPRDLVIDGDEGSWLVEAKVVYDGNASQAVRACLGQLFEYRFMLYADDETPRLLALFSEPVGLQFVALLESLDIAVVWRRDNGWAASPRGLDLIK